MPVARGSCPSCGAPIEFALGSSLANVCRFCRATVLRTDRGLQNLGRCADIANTPTLIAIGDQGTLAGRPIHVLGRVQLDWGAGPWDEFYVAFDHGKSWGWLAYAQGRWHVTSDGVTGPLPPFQGLQIEQSVDLGPHGIFVIGEARRAQIKSLEGEVPAATPPGTQRAYADCYGPQGRFATLDYGDGSAAPVVYVGYVFPETQLAVTERGPRTEQQVPTAQLTCPNCGGMVPKLSGERAERLGCPFCGAVSDIAERRVVATQKRLLQTPAIPIGARGQLDEVEYICLAYVKRSSLFSGERYTWEEFLLFAPATGYRWLVKDPETGWLAATVISLADLERDQAPSFLGYLGQRFSRRNHNQARVDYVIGEIYWKCEIGETVDVTDYACDQNVISREMVDGEVNYSYSVPVDWESLAEAFGLETEGLRPDATAASSGFGPLGKVLVYVILIAVVLLVCCIFNAGGSGGGSVGGSPGGVSYRGGGSYSGGK